MMQKLSKGLLITAACVLMGVALRYLAASKETPPAASGIGPTTPPTASGTGPKPPPPLQEQPVKTFTPLLKPGDTLSDLLGSFSVPPQEISTIIACSKKIYNLTKLRAGKTITLTVDRSAPSLLQLKYSYDDNHVLIVNKTDQGYSASQETIAYHVSLRSVKGTITSNLFDDAVRAGCPPQLIVNFADLFAWDIDFFTSVRENDEFKLLFEEIYLEGKLVRHGNILAAEFINQGKRHRVFRFGNGREGSGYYDDRGQSVAREFLKTPLRYSRISSGFSKRRLHPVLRIYRPHLGVDYAAPSGTPVEATANGKVIFMGWKGGYGKCVKIRHNHTYTSFYGHLARFAKGLKQGKQVQQGQVIGYVGSTGLATGPHLDYRLKKGEEFVNPVSFTSFQKDAVSKKLRPQFERTRRELLVKLEQLDDEALFAAASGF